jgi:hypothetical protein
MHNKQPRTNNAQTKIISLQQKVIPNIVKNTHGNKTKIIMPHFAVPKRWSLSTRDRAQFFFPLGRILGTKAHL